MLVGLYECLSKEKSEVAFLISARVPAVVGDLLWTQEQINFDRNSKCQQ